MIHNLQKLFLIGMTLILASCTIQLVPDYDKELVSGLDETNVKTMTLFAALDGGSDQSAYAEHKDDYIDVIGEFSALKQRAETRQIPPLTKQLKKVKFVSNFCNIDVSINECVNASPASIDLAAKTIARMRNRHKNAGLNADTVELFKTQYETAIKQALTVERALER